MRQDGQRFKVALTPGRPLAATYLANAIAWRQGGERRRLTPSRSGGFADNIVRLVRAGPLGQRQNGPFPVDWERSDEAERAALWQELAMPETCSVTDALAALEPHGHVPAVKTAKDWITHQRRVLGIEEIRRIRSVARLTHFAARRRYGGRARRVCRHDDPTG